MRKIKFSHTYTKMPKGSKKSILLEVLKTQYKDLSSVFVAYDTEIEGTHDHYPLPKTLLLVLVLYSDSGELWTTVRRWTPEKEEYYRNLRGQEVEIVVESSKC